MDAVTDSHNNSLKILFTLKTQGRVLVKTVITMGWEDNSLVKRLPCKHEDLSVMATIYILKKRVRHDGGQNGSLWLAGWLA